MKTKTRTEQVRVCEKRQRKAIVHYFMARFDSGEDDLGVSFFLLLVVVSQTNVVVQQMAEKRVP